MDTNNFIYSTAEKYQKTTILERLKALEADQQLKIGFVGMFSAGKTSLINALLDIHLPVNPNPTTKSICVIESDDNLENYEYFLEVNGDRIKSSFNEFEDVVAGRNTGVAVIRVPTEDEIPSGIIYVDTPGFDNYSSAETDLTYRYLALLDAAIVCIDINEGTVKKSLLDFISVPELFALSSRMFFVLTHADTKNQDGINSIREEVYKQIINFAEKTKFNIDNLKERIIAVNANNHDSSIQVVDVIHNYILKKRENIYKERIQNKEKELAKELATMLQDDLDNLKFNLPELSEKKNLITSELNNLEDELRRKNTQLDRLRDDLADNIYSILQSHELDITKAPDEETLRDTLISIQQEISTMAQNRVKSINDNLVVSLGEGLGTEIVNQIKRIDFFKNLSVTIVTSIATAFIAPGAGAAANVAEGTAGAVAQTAGKSAAKNTVGKAAEVGLFGKVFRGIGQIIHAVNPLEYVGDFIASELKSSNYSSLIKGKAVQMADHIVFSLEEIFHNEVIRPIENRYREQSETLSKLKAERDKGIKDFSQKREELKMVIDKLQEI